MEKAQHTPGLTLPLQLADATTTIPIKDATGKTIASVKYGPNDLDHASFIAGACNSHADLLELAKLFARSINYEIYRARASGDDEGANLKAMTLELCRAAIAKAEGRP